MSVGVGRVGGELFFAAAAVIVVGEVTMGSNRA